VVEKTVVLGYPQRMIQRQDDDPRAQANALGLAGDRSQAESGRRSESVLGKVVFGWPDGVELQILRGAHEPHLFVNDLVLCLVNGIFKEMEHPEFHRSPPVAKLRESQPVMAP
jgi:hypothetical protein